jgi:hypothetical protein
MRKLLVWLLLSTWAVSACTGGRTRHSQPASFVAEGWQDVEFNTLCLEVEQSFAEVDSDFSLPIEAAVRRILSGLGVKVASASSACDGTLSISFKGKALAQDYVCILGNACGHCFTGAQMSGELALTAANRTPWVRPLDASITPPGSISECPKVPQEAPFDSLWPGAVLAGLVELWGTPTLSVALDDPQESVRLAAVGLLRVQGAEGVPLLADALEDRTTNVRQRAALALGRLGVQAREAVPALIEVLDDNNRPVRLAAASALYLITGQDFGQDQAGWRKWLREPSLTPALFISWKGVAIMPEAKPPEELGSMLQYTVDVSCEEVAAFYQAEMPVAGWTLIESGNPSGSSQRLKFEQSRDTAEVNLSDASEPYLSDNSQVMEKPRCSVQIFFRS